MTWLGLTSPSCKMLSQGSVGDFSDLKRSEASEENRRWQVFLCLSETIQAARQVGQKEEK